MPKICTFLLVLLPFFLGAQATKNTRLGLVAAPNFSTIRNFDSALLTDNMRPILGFTTGLTLSGGSTWQWLLDGTPFASGSNASYTFNSIGTFVVTLQAANADPNCSGTFSDTVKVTCPVNASFTTSNLYPLPGETVNFTNATTGGATSYAWTVNGTAAGSAANFSYQIPAEGVYSICLQAGNGLCGEGFCQVVFAFEASGEDCVGTFIRSIGGTSQEAAHSLLPTPDGNFLVGGSRGSQSLLMLVNPVGEPIWERTFDFTGGSDFIRNMMLDSEGMLVANGRDQYNVATLNFTFRYEWQTNTILWARLMPDPAYTRLEGILENPVNGNYLLLGLVENQTTSLDNVVFEVSRSNGALVWMRSFDAGSTTDVYYAGTVYENELFLTGNQRYGDLDKIRTSVSRLDLDGDQQWTRIYLRNPNTTARLYGEDIHVENDTVVVLSRGSLSNDDLFASTVQLFKTDPDGEIYWAKSYSFSGGNTAVARSIVPLPDGYVLHGNLNLTGSSKDFFFIRTDKQGNVIWSKALGENVSDESRSAVFHGGFIYFIGTSSEGAPGGSDNVLFGRMTLDGEISGVGCDFVHDLNVTAANISNAYDGQHDLTQESQNYGQNSTSKTPVEVDLEVADLSGCECEEFEDSCAIAPDAVLQFATAACAGDSILVNLTICNDSAGILTQGTPITFYLGNPTTAAAQVLATKILPQDLLSGDCISFPVKLVAVPANAAVFVMVNDDGTNPTPWNFDDFPNTSLFECNFPNNLNSFTIAYSPPTLDLGADLAVCHFATATFDAGAGFASYNWHDGSHEQTFTAWTPGTFWVTVVDSCGGTQTDEVTVTIEPGTIVEIGVDTAKICEGGSLDFTVSGFDHYAWTPSAGGGLSCDTCASVTATPDTSGSLILVASTDDGCYSVDTVQIQLLPTQATAEVIEFCPGTTVIVFGNPVSVPGDYSQVFSDLNGCDSTHTITLVEVTDTALIVDTMVICAGDSVEFFGEWLSVSGVYDHFEPFGNCIQHNQLVLQVLPPLLLDLAVQPPTCFGFSDASLTVQGGQGNLQFSLDGVNWQPGNVFDSLVAGSYEVFVLDENGCQFQAEIIVNDPQQVFVQLPPDATIEWGDTLTILPTVLQNDLEFSWLPPDWLPCTACQNPVAQPEDTILYLLTVTAPGGCTASDSIQINVELTKAVQVPNIFTPNGDGINEHFFVFGKGIAEVRLLRIFDRWGELVFEGKNFPANEESFGWDGNFRSKAMNSEVFAWQVIVTFADGTEAAKTGDLTLIR